MQHMNADACRHIYSLCAVQCSCQALCSSAPAACLPTWQCTSSPQVLTPVTNDAYCPSLQPYTFQDSAGSITSQPGGYKPNSQCLWELIYQASPYITITADIFDTEAGYDWVDVYDAFGLVGAMSGSKLKYSSYTTDSGGLLIACCGCLLGVPAVADVAAGSDCNGCRSCCACCQWLQ
jgi:hypothetical protein